MLTKLIATIPCFTLLLACGKSSKNDETKPNSPPPASLPIGLVSTSDNQSLLGSWTSECKPCGNSFCETSFEIRDDLLIRNLDQFADNICVIEQMHVRHVGSYSAAGGKLTSMLSQTHMKLEVEALSRAAERSQSCGFDSWPLKTWLDVTGRECKATPEQGGVWSDVTTPGQVIVRVPYVLEDNRLVLKFSKGDARYTKDAQ